MSRKRKFDSIIVPDKHDDHDEDIQRFVELPSEIMAEIISRLPVKSILLCKCVCRVVHDLISSPSFSSIYNGRSDRLTAILYEEVPDPLVLIEIDRSASRISETVSETAITAPGSCSSSDDGAKFYCHFFGCCDGIVLLLKREGGYFHLFVENPILAKSIRLPQPIAYSECYLLAFGFGYCQFSKKYKVLRIKTHYLGSNDYRNETQIFTLGLDQTWRSVEDANVPYNMVSNLKNPIFMDRIRQRSMMLALESALHWLVGPVQLPIARLEPKWGDKDYICAFDLKEEKANAIPLPPPGDTVCQRCYRFGKCRCYHNQLGVILGKLCICNCNSTQFDIWVMVEYGNASSWTKQYILKTSRLPYGFIRFDMEVRAVLDQGVIVLSDSHRFVFYDLIREKILMYYILTNQGVYDGPMLFYPKFLLPDFFANCMA